MSDHGFLYARTDFLDPGVMGPTQSHIAQMRADFDSAVSAAGPVTPVSRNQVDDQIKEATDGEVDTITSLLAAVHGLTFGDSGSIDDLRRLVIAAEQANVDVAQSLHEDPHAGHH